MSLKELKSLAPWNWDGRVVAHPPGRAALQDFEKIESAWRQDTKDGAGQTPGPTPTPRSRRSSNGASANYDFTGAETPNLSGQGRKAASAERARSLLKRKVAELQTPDSRQQPQKQQRQQRYPAAQRPVREQDLACTQIPDPDADGKAPGSGAALTMQQTLHHGQGLEPRQPDGQRKNPLAAFAPAAVAAHGKDTEMEALDEPGPFGYDAAATLAAAAAEPPPARGAAGLVSGGGGGRVTAAQGPGGSEASDSAPGTTLTPVSVTRPTAATGAGAGVSADAGNPLTLQRAGECMRPPKWTPPLAPRGTAQHLRQPPLPSPESCGAARPLASAAAAAAFLAGGQQGASGHGGFEGLTPPSSAVPAPRAHDAGGPVVQRALEGNAPPPPQPPCRTELAAQGGSAGQPGSTSLAVDLTHAGAVASGAEGILPVAGASSLLQERRTPVCGSGGNDPTPGLGGGSADAAAPPGSHAAPQHHGWRSAAVTPVGASERPACASQQLGLSPADPASAPASGRPALLKLTPTTHKRFVLHGMVVEGDSSAQSRHPRSRGGSGNGKTAAAPTPAGQQQQNHQQPSVVLSGRVHLAVQQYGGYGQEDGQDFDPATARRSPAPTPGQPQAQPQPGMPGASMPEWPSGQSVAGGVVGANDAACAAARAAAPALAASQPALTVYDPAAARPESGSGPSPAVKNGAGVAGVAGPVVAPKGLPRSPLTVRQAAPDLDLGNARAGGAAAVDAVSNGEKAPEVKTLLPACTAAPRLSAGGRRVGPPLGPASSWPDRTAAASIPGPAVAAAAASCVGVSGCGHGEQAAEGAGPGRRQPHAWQPPVRKAVETQGRVEGQGPCKSASPCPAAAGPRRRPQPGATAQPAPSLAAAGAGTTPDQHFAQSLRPPPSEREQQRAGVAAAHVPPQGLAPAPTPPAAEAKERVAMGMEDEAEDGTCRRPCKRRVTERQAAGPMEVGGAAARPTSGSQPAPTAAAARSMQSLPATAASAAAAQAAASSPALAATTTTTIAIQKATSAAAPPAAGEAVSTEPAAAQEQPLAANSGAAALAASTAPAASAASAEALSAVPLTQQQLLVLGQLLAFFRATGCRHPAAMTAAELVAAMSKFCQFAGIPVVPTNIQMLASWLGTLLALERPVKTYARAQAHAQQAGAQTQENSADGEHQKDQQPQEHLQQQRHQRDPGHEPSVLQQGPQRQQHQQMQALENAPMQHLRRPQPLAPVEAEGDAPMQGQEQQHHHRRRQQAGGSWAGQLQQAPGQSSAAQLNSEGAGRGHGVCGVSLASRPFVPEPQPHHQEQGPQAQAVVPPAPGSRGQPHQPSWLQGREAHFPAAPSAHQQPSPPQRQQQQHQALPEAQLRSAAAGGPQLPSGPHKQQSGQGQQQHQQQQQQEGAQLAAGLPCGGSGGLRVAASDSGPGSRVVEMAAGDDPAQRAAPPSSPGAAAVGVHSAATPCGPDKASPAAALPILPLDPGQAAGPTPVDALASEWVSMISPAVQALYDSFATCQQLLTRRGAAMQPGAAAAAGQMAEAAAGGGAAAAAAPAPVPVPAPYPSSAADAAVQWQPPQTAATAAHAGGVAAAVRADADKGTTAPRGPEGPLLHHLAPAMPSPTAQPGAAAAAAAAEGQAAASPLPASHETTLQQLRAQVLQYLSRQPQARCGQTQAALAQLLVACQHNPQLATAATSAMAGLLRSNEAPAAATAVTAPAAAPVDERHGVVRHHPGKVQTPTQSNTTQTVTRQQPQPAHHHHQAAAAEAAGGPPLCLAGGTVAVASAPASTSAVAGGHAVSDIGRQSSVTAPSYDPRAQRAQTHAVVGAAPGVGLGPSSPRKVTEAAAVGPPASMRVAGLTGSCIAPATAAAPAAPSPQPQPQPQPHQHHHHHHHHSHHQRHHHPAAASHASATSHVPNHTTAPTPVPAPAPNTVNRGPSVGQTAWPVPPPRTTQAPPAVMVAPVATYNPPATVQVVKPQPAYQQQLRPQQPLLHFAQPQPHPPRALPTAVVFPSPPVGSGGSGPSPCSSPYLPTCAALEAGALAPSLVVPAPSLARPPPMPGNPYAVQYGYTRSWSSGSANAGPYGWRPASYGSTIGPGPKAVPQPGEPWAYQRAASAPQYCGAGAVGSGGGSGGRRWAVGTTVPTPAAVPAELTVNGVAANGFRAQQHPPGPPPWPAVGGWSEGAGVVRGVMQAPGLGRGQEQAQGYTVAVRKGGLSRGTAK